MAESTPKTCLALPHKEIKGRWFSEHLLDDNPLAVEVARPMFDAGIMKAAITERTKYFFWCGPGVTEDHRFTLLLQGEMTMQFGDQFFKMDAGQIAYCAPGTLFERTGPFKTWWIYFTISDSEMWQSLKERGCYIRDYENMDLVYILMRHILDAHKSREPVAIEDANLKAQMVVDLLKRECQVSAPRQVRPSNELGKLVAAVVTRPEADWDLGKMAGQLHVSPNTLIRMMKSRYNQSPIEFVIRMRLSKARELLLRTDYTVDEVAQQVGYESTSSFCHLFKRHMGVTPGYCRQRGRG